MRVNESPGFDGVSAVSIKRCSDHIVPTLTEIINLAIFTGVYPDHLKVAKVCAVYKSESRSNPSNYRPISVLTMFV